MLKKALVLLSVFLALSIPLSCFAEKAKGVNPDLSPYGSESAGIGLKSVGGIQFLRGAFTNSNGGTIDSINYIDCDSETQYYVRGSSSSFVHYYGQLEEGAQAYFVDVHGNETEGDFNAFIGESYPNDTSTRFSFSPTYIWNSYGADVGMQWVLPISEGNSWPSRLFSKGQSAFIHFTLYFENLEMIDKLEFTVTSPDNRYYIGGQGSAVWDNRNGFKYLGTALPSTNANSPGQSNIVSIDLSDVENVSNYLTFRIPIYFNENAQMYAFPKKVTYDSNNHPSTVYQYVHKFNFMISNFSYGNGSGAVQKAGENAVDKGSNSISQSQGESANASISSLVSSMGYTGTSAVLSIPSFTWGLGNIIPSRKWFDGGTNCSIYAPISIFTPSNHFREGIILPKPQVNEGILKTALVPV